MTDDKQEPSCYPNGNLFPGNRGLTIRDHFAGLAMQMMLAQNGALFGDLYKVNAEDAYKMADAMMAQREK